MTEIRQMTYEPVGDRDGGRGRDRDRDRGRDRDEDGSGSGAAVTSAVETMTFDRLRELNDGGTQRADFHVLAVVDAGHGSVTVDFLRHPIEERSAVWIAPGAVHRWADIAGVAGHLVLFTPTAPVTRATRERVASPDLAARWRIPDADQPYVDAALSHLVLETTAAPPPDDMAAELPGILLSALIARLRPPDGEAGPANPTFQLFRSSVEAYFREQHGAAYYARALGYAPRTLSRAVQQATGRTAKAYIVDRIVLEAKRLLAHEGLTAASCARALGFPDASNFSVFFRNATGVRPGAWQATATAGG
ncbi:helix-turn-helix domain-containing protein [Streptomyces longisporoflavus]|uniref:Helix-turn-helix domain-containing protein n=1 Tax=Streptomyces longisporoflavus TaxID=28044 RepID=A0ABW7R5P5_9ACTN